VSLIISDVCKAFEPKCVGTKVISPGPVLSHLTRMLDKDDYKIVLPDAVNAFVSCGVGLRSEHPDDYVIRKYRNRVDLYLKRSYAAETRRVTAIVYPVERYLEDPQITVIEKDAIKAVSLIQPKSHVLVALLAETEMSPPPLTPYRLVANLAGGSNEWTFNDFSVDPKIDPPFAQALRHIQKIENEARASIDYDRKWCVVAD
jgi:hypothetical protein